MKINNVTNQNLEGKKGVRVRVSMISSITAGRKSVLSKTEMAANRIDYYIAGKKPWISATYYNKHLFLAHTRSPASPLALQGSTSVSWVCILCHTDVSLLHRDVNIHAYRNGKKG